MCGHAKESLDDYISYTKGSFPRVLFVGSMLMQELVGFGMTHLSHLIQDKDPLNSQLIQGWLLGW
jgi:hypothetical protein